MRKDADILIRVETSGNPPMRTVKVNIDEATVSQDGQVTWRCADHPFAILFKNDTPFDKSAFAGDPGETVNVHVKKKQPGHYDYEVAVTCAEPPQPGLLDPKIIVE